MDLPNDIPSCHKIIRAQAAQLEELRSVVEILTLKITELESRLDKNSRNSNKPPSSDGLSKPSPQPALKKSPKSRGGQKGHKGKTLELVATPDEVVELKPHLCNCGHCLDETTLSLLEKRQVFDLPEPKLLVREYQRYGGDCPKCGSFSSSAFPPSVVSRVQYGSGVRALSVLLNTNYCLSVDKIKHLFDDLYGYLLNENSITTYNKTCYNSLEPSEQLIKESILLGKVAHGDETGLRVAGKLHWLHVCCSKLYTYLFVDPKRGKEAVFSEKSILPQLKGWVVHDCWATYFKLDGCKHAICGAHILRELQALKEKGVIWASWFHCYLLGLLALTKKSSENALTEEEQQKAQKLFDKIWEAAHQIEPMPKKGKRGRAKATKGRNLLKRFKEHKNAVIAFAMHSEVPFTNNLAERDIRPAKVKQKVAGCFRTEEGAKVYARITGFISTARKQGKNVFTELKKSFNGSTFMTQKMKC